MYRFLFVFSFIMVFFVSCQSVATSDLTSSGNGTASVNLTVDQNFLNFYNELLVSLGLDGQLDRQDPFQVESIRKILNQYARVDLKGIKQAKKNTLEVTWNFQNIQAILSDYPYQEDPVAKLSSSSDKKTTLTFRLNRSNVGKILQLFPDLTSNPTVSVFLPSESNQITEAEYTEFTVYFLEENLANAKKLFLDSTLIFKLVFPSSITAHTGEGRISGKTLELQFPLVRVLALEKPIQFTVTY